VEQIRTTVRMPAGLLKAIEEVRNPEEIPTLTDFIRRAVEHYVKELRRKKLTEECLSLSGEEDLSTWTEVDFAEHAERITRAERGEL